MTREVTTLRTFVAVPLPTAVKEQLRRVQRYLEGAAGPSGVSWGDPQGLHITLKFLGNVQTDRVAAIADALRRGAEGILPFALTFSQLGAFPSLQRPRVVWIGATGAVDTLGALYEQIERELTALRFPPETRPFSPHITLGRVRDRPSPGLQQRLADAMGQAPALREPPTMLVEEVLLYQSTLTPRGAIYSVLVAVNLRGEESTN